MTNIGRIHSIESFGTLDGPGLRYVLFLQGCPAKCLYCHNPDSIERDSGTFKTADEVLKDIISYKNFIKKGGVTISGGEPLLQPEFVLEIITRCRYIGLHTAIDTAGTVSISESARVIEAADLILLDIKSLDNSICDALTSMPNYDTLETLDYCEKIGKKVWIRHVLVPGYTLDDKLLDDLARYISKFKCVERVELLPYHNMGEYKWAELGEEYMLKGVPTPTKEEVQNAHEIFEKYGLSVF